MGPVSVPREDLREVAQMMGEFDRATSRLEDSYHKISELQKKLAEKDRQLERKTRMETLGHLASSLAHEIRNPLGGIQLYAAMLCRDLAGDPVRIQAIEKIRSAVEGLDRMVGEMLDFGRDLVPKKELRPLAPLVEEAIGLARPALDPKEIFIVHRLNSGVAEVDPSMIRRVFLNIILNAAQAMEAQGILTVACGRGWVSFSDTGPGIAKELMEGLFEPFVTAKPQGSGLGLAVARRIVEAHGGVIEARNNPGRGAIFTIKL